MSKRQKTLLKFFLILSTLFIMAESCDDDFLDFDLPDVETRQPSVASATKPVVFVNNGSQTVTASVATYLPEIAGVPVPVNTTVVAAIGSPGLHTNPSASLTLPLGMYTFCYKWESDQDLDQNGYFDLYHIFDTRPVTLDINDSDSFELAETVYIAIHADDYNRIPGDCPAPMLTSDIPPAPPAVDPQPNQDVSSQTAITNVWLEHNVEYQGRTSLFIHINFQISQVDSQSAWIVAGFWYANGSPMEGVEANFTTDSGQAASWGEVFVDYEVTTWDDFTLFIPADVLQPGEGVYATVEIWDQASGAMLAQLFTESFDVYR